MLVVILGAGGQLGYELQKGLADWTLVPFTRQDVDICDYARLNREITAVKPDLVINAAAYTEVDESERKVQKAFQVNAFAVRELARICADLGSILVQISTDYVFGGQQNRAYQEDDLPQPRNVYGNAKLVGEYFVRSLCPEHYIVRTSGLFGLGGLRSKAGNFVETVIQRAEERKPISVVDDQFFSPTYTKHFLLGLKKLLLSEEFGLYHLTNSGSCSWYSFAAAIFERMPLDPEIIPVSTKEFNAPASRPGFSVLSNAKYVRTVGHPLPEWEEALADYLAARG